MNNFQKILVRAINRQFEVVVDLLECTGNVAMDTNDPDQLPLHKALINCALNMRDHFKIINDAAQNLAKAKVTPPPTNPVNPNGELNEKLSTDETSSPSQEA